MTQQTTPASTLAVMSALPAALGRIRPAVEHRLEEILSMCRRRWEGLGPAAPELLETARSVLGGGKRMRAVLGVESMERRFRRFLE